jgi:hypothetical protein
MVMSKHAWQLAVPMVVLGVGIGVAIGAHSQQTNGQPPSHGHWIASSATGVQTFAWILDEGGNLVTFCYSTASPQMGPQFDFTCKRRPMPTEVP